MREPRALNMLTLRIWLLASDSSYPTYELGRFSRDECGLGRSKTLCFSKKILEEEFFEDEKIPRKN